MYKYGMRMRGFSIGCQPMNGLVERQDDTSGLFYDILVYDRLLTQKEIDDYELDRIVDVSRERRTDMKYYVVSRMPGAFDEDDYFETLQDAKAERDRREAIDVANGNQPDFWYVMDENWKEC